jgi:outer membrane protein assembly factor BamE (lipoprotein component of BamABCDE complex)
MRRFSVLSLLTGSLLLVLVGCATEPPPEPTQEQPVDPGWEQRTVDTSFETELPDPFIKLVDLQRLRVGMTKQEVLAIFPGPDETTLRGRDELWDYGFAELIFRGNRLADWFNKDR